MVVSAITVLEDVVGPVVAVFGAVVVDEVCDIVVSFVVVSTGFAVVFTVVDVGTLVVVVKTVGLEVTTIASLLVVIAETDEVVSGITIVADVVGPVVTIFGAIDDEVCDVVASFVVVSTGFSVVCANVDVGTLVVMVKTVGLEVTTVVSLLVVVLGTDEVVSGITMVEDFV